MKNSKTRELNPGPQNGNLLCYHWAMQSVEIWDKQSRNKNEEMGRVYGHTVDFYRSAIGQTYSFSPLKPVKSEGMACFIVRTNNF